MDAWSSLAGRRILRVPVIRGNPLTRQVVKAVIRMETSNPGTSTPSLAT
jgi:hypothetical protein